jgi:hypothetical protein
MNAFTRKRKRLHIADRGPQPKSVELQAPNCCQLLPMRSVPFLVLGRNAARRRKSTCSHRSATSSPRRIPVSSSSRTAGSSQGGVVTDPPMRPGCARHAASNRSSSSPTNRRVRPGAGVVEHDVPHRVTHRKRPFLAGVSAVHVESTE